MPVFLYFLAGGMFMGSVAVLDEANHRRAADQLRRRQELEAELLAGAIKTEELRRQARDAGIDPDVVAAGYEAMRRGDITFTDLRQILAVVN